MVRKKIDECKKSSLQINKECGFTATSYRKIDGKDYWSSCFPTDEKWKRMKKVIGLSDEYDFVIRNNIKERCFIEPSGNLHKGSGYNIQFTGKQLSDNPIEETAKLWEGWGTALKPAHEPIVMARKPVEKGMSVAQNVLKHGAGGINIDDCRIEMNNEEQKGRYPSNLIHDGSDEVKICFPNSNGANNSIPQVKITGYGNKIGNGKYNYIGGDRIPFESGNASRFFKSIIYSTKTSTAEREFGLDDIEYPKEQLFGLDTRDRTFTSGSKTLDRCKTKPRKNNHTTVKPIKLMRYLVRLVTAKNGLVLDPFAGSGSTGVACRLEGFDFVVIELDKHYKKVAQARLDNWKEYLKIISQEEKFNYEIKKNNTKLNEFF